MVPNQIFADFEILLKNPKYNEIEKNKTIGSYFMAASVLNKKIRSTSLKKNAHLISLLEFSQKLQAILNKFNTDLFNFNFNMFIGFNVGLVVADVIGNTKLSYDIWGDAVNLSSRILMNNIIYYLNNILRMDENTRSATGKAALLLYIKLNVAVFVNLIKK
ncbi:hypothetical protein A3Q56_01276 [Intoshia linei]|uniref:adenylate cyclase n=1 Tax=Intoshia linei TaxID=1819745 RepID=A0A177B9G1_9BILA|nr:hypothetical protein A3Q56_01276 [Intoshia linei]